MPARLVRPPAALLSTVFFTACLTACLAVGLSSLSTVPPAGATPGPEKESPYAAATDGGVPPAAGTTEKESPYAAAKDELALSFGPSLGKLWWLLLPTGLAAGSYLYLRRQEGASR
jgi:hypothetical protein